MHARSASAALIPMDERDEHILQTATDRFERRLAEETGKVRVEMAHGFGSLRTEISGIRSEMIERNHELLKWALLFFAAHVAATTGLLALFV